MEPNDNIQKYQYLASKWMNKTITEEELQLFNSWYDSDIEKEVELSEEFAESEERLQARMLRGINQKINKPKEFVLWPRLAVAMSFLILLSVTFYIYRYRKVDEGLLVTMGTDNRILPGQTGATLTLADGKKISLSGRAAGELANENGVRISKTDDGQLQYELGNDLPHGKGINNLSTSMGETYMVILPDKSKVWLNAASSIEFEAGLNNPKSRLIKLTGEAYFEVAKDKSRPFIVSSDKQQVVVLGTHFNINAYPDQQYAETTLVEGSVEVTDLRTKEFKILKPLQQAHVGVHRINIQTVDVDEMLAWRNGEFALGAENFESTLQHIERWYNVKFDHRGVPIKDIALDGWISRSSELSEVLRKIEMGTNLRFEIKGRRIVIIR